VFLQACLPMYRFNRDEVNLDAIASPALQMKTGRPHIEPPIILCFVGVSA
jgi:hypothetical protein